VGLVQAADLVIPASPASQKVLSAAQVASIRAYLGKQMHGPVRVQLYTDGPGCEACEVTGRVLQQIQEAAPKLTVNTTLAAGARRAGEALDRLPDARVFTSNGNHVRFLGTQVGVEVTSLVQTIADASLPQAPVPPDALKRAGALPAGSWLRVFVGPACTHCPGAVRAAVALALANRRLAVDVIQTADFPDLGRSFKITAVPTTVVNGRAFFPEGRSPLDVLEALLANPPKEPGPHADS
jgi:alkyl hydroperoxide reductase subunit AhpF